MTIDGDILEIELDMSLKDVVDLKNFVLEKLEYIEEIKIVGEMKIFASSSLLQLLHSVKKSKPSMNIAAVDGSLTLEEYGVIHWMKHD